VDEKNRRMLLKELLDQIINPPLGTQPVFLCDGSA